jgi:aspartyl aminopeptidase
MGCGAAGPAGRAAPTPGSADEMAAEYRAWLDYGRTAADVVDFARAHAPGWHEVDLFATTASRTRPGDRLIFVVDDRSALFAVVGATPFLNGGARLVCGHIDTPAPRLRARAIVDEQGEARLVAERYGGLRPHQWAGMPLALVGRVAKVGGAIVPIRLGVDEDFAFYAVESTHERIVAVAATTPPPVGETRPAATFLAYLHDRYGLTSADLEAAELYLVPRMAVREVGLDRQLIGAHGQDDRLNSYAAWRAVLDLGSQSEPPRHTAIAWLVDREEVGSHGTAGARSRALELVYAWLLRAEGTRPDEVALHRAFAASRALSADTPAGLNPNWPEVHIERIAPRLGLGPVAFPYAGRRGKHGSNTARAEILAELARVFAGAGVPLQVAELGKVDAGGGGTIASYLGMRGVDVIDVGIPVVSMHSPMELSHKRDLWWGYLGFKAWLRE